LRAFTALALVGCLAGCSVINHPPSVALISDQTVSIGERLSLELYGQDPDGDPLIWRVTGLGDEAEIIQLTAPTDDDPTQPSRALLVWSPTLQDLESSGSIYQVVVDADDDQGGVATQSFTVTVNVAYGVPLFDLPSGFALNLAETEALNLDVVVKDDDSEKLELLAKEAPEGAIFKQTGNKKGTLFWEPTSDQRIEIVHRFVLTAVDDTHDPIDHVLLVVLVNTGAAAGCTGSVPTVAHTALPDTILTGAPVTVSLTATDVESAVTSVALRWSEAPEGGEFEAEAMGRLADDSDVWSAEITVPGGSVPVGGKLIHYYIEAYDNDDPTGHDCDRAVRWPKSGYGAFAVYASGDQASCVDDGFEPDDTVEKAPLVEPGSYPGRRLCGGSPDLVRIQTPAGGELVARVVREPSHGTVSVRLLNSNGTPLDAASGDAEVLSVSAPATGQDAIIEISSSDPNVGLTYALELSVMEGVCTADQFEATGGNDTPADATGLGTGSWANLQICTDDQDWFRFDLDEGQSLEVAITFQHQFGDLDLELLDVTGTSLISAAASQSSYELVTYTAPNAISVMAHVQGYQGDTNGYRLDATVTSPDGSCPEDVAGMHVSPVTALVLFSGYYDGMVACPQVPDWYAVDLNGGETVTIEVSPGDSSLVMPGGPIQLELFSGGESASVDTATAVQGQSASASYTMPSAGRLSYRVSASISSAYSLDQWVLEPTGPCQPDRLEPNDDEAAATSVEPGVITRLRLCDNTDIDVFAVTLEALQTLTVMTSHEEGWGYTDAYIKTPSGDGELSIDWDVGVVAEFLAEEAGVYIVEIQPWEVEALPYDLGIWIE
jgi:hypothetical protein